ncbi:Fur family transcriptional regulator [Bradyrhizobium murdochi]|uniref:Fur family transcriptional regulator n=1 Tax=Bradyrhizobium murdochi TaxID=1038859 RepID=UPI00041072E5|nr:Fur family transcriptional regulator [Bradyrhizobium murdochi]
MKSKLDEEFERLCREKGLRLTGPRRIILDVLAKASDHPDAIEVHRRASLIDPSIAIATVYRTVRLLEDSGILESHAFGDGRARYETADREHHDHLINIETGDVIEFRSDEIERLQEGIARAHGFEIVSHRLEIFVKPLKGGKRKKTSRDRR